MADLIGGVGQSSPVRRGPAGGCRIASWTLDPVLDSLTKPDSIRERGVPALGGGSGGRVASEIAPPVVAFRR